MNFFGKTTVCADWLHNCSAGVVRVEGKLVTEAVVDWLDDCSVGLGWVKGNVVTETVVDRPDDFPGGVGRVIWWTEPAVDPEESVDPSKTVEAYW